MEEQKKPFFSYRTSRQKQLQKATKDPAKNNLLRLREFEEGRALLRLWQSKGDAKFKRPHGLIHGLTRTQTAKMRAKAKREAQIIVRHMMDNNMIPKDGYAKEAIEAAVEVMRMDAIHVRDKLAAAKVVLEFTMTKPETKSSVSVKTAEDFLSEIAKDAGIGG